MTEVKTDAQMDAEEKAKHGTNLPFGPSHPSSNLPFGPGSSPTSNNKPLAMKPLTPEEQKVAEVEKKGDIIVVDKISGNPVAVRARDVKVEVEELQRLMKNAHDSMGDLKISELPLDHPYWGLMSLATKYQQEKGL